MSAIAPGMILLAYLCGSISSAILVAALPGYLTRVKVVPEIRERPTCFELAAREQP